MFDGGLFEALESRGHVGDALSDVAFVRAMLRVEAALAEASAGAGLIPSADAAAIAAACSGPAPEPALLGTEATATGTPVAPLLAWLRSRLAPEVGESLHRGATSQDIMDTATMLVAAGALGVIVDDLAGASRAAATLAQRHEGTIMAGRTLLQQAEPTTFGLKAVGWMSGLDQAAERVAWVRDERLAVQLGGPAGTRSGLGPEAGAIVEDVATRLMLRASIVPWHTERGRIVDLAASLGVAAAAVAKPALDIVLMAQTEVGEASDDDPTRGGSSSMAHKRNPIAAVAARACAAQAPGLVANLVAAASGHEHERAAGAWHAEWRSLRALLGAVGSAAAWLRDAVEHLSVDPERMRGNLVVASDTSGAGQATALVRRALEAHALPPGRSVRVHHIVTGPADAPTLVLVNSLGSTLAMWDPQVDVLARHFRVVRHDLRGHGRSPTPPPPYRIDELGADLLTLLDELGVPRVHVVGSSIGGMIGLWVAAHAPERIDRLVVAGTSARLGPPEAWTGRAAAVLGGGMEAVAASVAARWITPGFAQAQPEALPAYEAMFMQADPAGYAGCCLAIAAMDQLATLGNIRARTLVIQGGDDPATPPEHGELIARGVPGARLEVLPEAAHLPSLEHPDRFTRLVLEHLGAVTAEATT